MRSLILVAGVSLMATPPLAAQWTHRYPKVEGYSHHVYLEGYELPLLTSGPIDPAPSPDGREVAFASRGWLWILALETGVATRVTRGAGMDSRPAWSPAGDRIAFVRDDGSETAIVMLDRRSGQETVAVSTPALDLDPAFSPDGGSLYFASAAAGDIDLWRLDLATGDTARVTSQPGIELKPQPHPDGRRVLLVAKRGANDVRMLDLASGEQTVLATERITSMTRPALSPDGALVAYNWPTQERYELRLLAADEPGTSLLLTASDGLPLTPAWSADGQWIYFSEADTGEVMELKRIRREGGRPELVSIGRWDWGEDTGVLRITTLMEGEPAPASARLAVVDQTGHPVIPDVGQSRFDMQNGRVFFYSPGTIEVTVPAGEVRVSAVQGIATPEVSITQRVAAGEIQAIALTLQPVWDPREDGWISGDHHFHLNYGGPYRLDPEDLHPMLEAEAIDVATPLLANLHNRFEEQDLFGWERGGGAPLVWFGQEVRSHFLGHLGLIGIRELFWPWVWGPGYQVYGLDDRPNTAVVDHTRRQGGLAIYVHPVSDRDPFQPEGIERVPVEMVVDGVLGRFDLLEVACLWTDELGTSEFWYRLLNLGVPIAPSAGTDVMNDYYRTMAVGTTRVYVRTDGAIDWPAYLAALKAGRSFVTTGPLLDFEVGDGRPGDAVPGGGTEWTLDLHSAVAVARVEILVNGEVVWSDHGLDAAGTRSYGGRLTLPAGGWVAARAVGSVTRWPAMNSYPFAHTSPVWIEAVGSTDPAAAQRAAQELLRMLDASEGRLHRGYAGVEIPRIQARFDEARARLVEAAGE